MAEPVHLGVVLLVALVGDRVSSSSLLQVRGLNISGLVHSRLRGVPSPSSCIGVVAIATGMCIYG